jgi:hypothetical protein
MDPDERWDFTLAADAGMHRISSDAVMRKPQDAVDLKASAIVVKKYVSILQKAPGIPWAKKQAVLRTFGPDGRLVRALKYTS